MRAQRLSFRVWRLVAVFAVTVYFYSFGTFLSRMMTIRPMTSLERHPMTSFLYESTRLFDSVRNETMQNQIHVLERNRTSVAEEASVSLVRSTSDLRESEKGATNSLTSPTESKPEVTKLGPEMTKLTPEESRMEVNVQRMLQSMKQSTVNSSLEGGGGVSRDSRTNWTSGSDHVVNPHPFKYVINTETLCDNNSDSIFVVVYVHSAPDHHKRRMVIRQTWGDVKQYPVDVRIVFFTGSPSSSGIQRAMAFEAEQYGDMVQEDFVDSYRNLTYKGIAALKWISTFCNRAKFVLKTDDDIFVNMFTLIRHLKRMDRLHNGTISHLLTCLVWYNMPVLRSGKWMVSKEDWKEDTYPTYCSGSAFVMTTDVAVALHNASYFVPFFWVDDLYVTGLLPLKLGTIKHTQFMSAYLLDGKQLEAKFTGAQWYKYIFCHVSDMTAIQRVWKKVEAIHNGKLVPTIQFVIPQALSTSPAPPPPPH